MKKKSSESSRREKLASVSADYIFNKPLTAKQKAVLRKIKAKQDAGDDSDIDFSDIPELTEEQLASAKRAGRVPDAASEWPNRSKPFTPDALRGEALHAPAS